MWQANLKAGGGLGACACALERSPSELRTPYADLAEEGTVFFVIKNVSGDPWSDDRQRR